MPDASKLNLLTNEGMDKVVATDIFEHVMPAAVEDTPGSGFFLPVEQMRILTNPYGRKGFITVQFSLDNVNFYPGRPILFNPGVGNPQYERGTVGAACDDTNIFFYFTHYIGAVTTFYVRWALDTVN